LGFWPIGYALSLVSVELLRSVSSFAPNVRYQPRPKAGGDMPKLGSARL
jgi:hypothetical protein